MKEMPLGTVLWLYNNAIKNLKIKFGGFFKKFVCGRPPPYWAPRGLTDERIL